MSQNPEVFQQGSRSPAGWRNYHGRRRNPSAVPPLSYPALSKRYQALLIDNFFILLLLIVIMLVTGETEQRQTIMVTSAIIMIFIYEPFMTAFYTTLGQRMMNIRVRRFANPEKRISLGHAYIRWFIKALLGWLSFITVTFNRDRRAIHDMAGNTIVMKSSSQGSVVRGISVICNGSGPFILLLKTP